jgi:dTDP-glucose pyrophosphorylase
MTRRAVVLARGLGRRMQEPEAGVSLTPAQERAAVAGLKGMMPIHGRAFVEFLLDALADAGLDRIALIVAPDHDMIARYFSERTLQRVTIEFLVQQEPLGTADAVLSAERWTAVEPFLAMNSDTLYPVPVLRQLAALDEPGLPVFARDELVRSSNISAERVQSYAFLEIDAEGYLAGIVEKPTADQAAAAGPSAPISMNCWRFDARIFRACRNVPRSLRGEFELPEAVGAAVTEGLRFRTFRAHGRVLDLSRRGDTAAVEAALADVTPRL